MKIPSLAATYKEEKKTSSTVSRGDVPQFTLKESASRTVCQSEMLNAEYFSRKAFVVVSRHGPLPCCLFVL